MADDLPPAPGLSFLAFVPRPFAFNQATFSDRVLVLEVCVPKAAALSLASKGTGTTATDAFEVKSAAAAAPSLLSLPIPEADVKSSDAGVLAAYSQSSSYRHHRQPARLLIC
jgi:hypothetical protein